MYLARERINGMLSYFIRESYPDGEVMRSRELFSLGPDPTAYIVYPGGNAYYVDMDLEAEVRSRKPLGPIYEQLEEILWVFVHPEVRHAVEPFRRREKSVKRERRRRHETLHADFHLFDKRRIHYLRFGQMDQGRIGAIPAKLLRALHGKSRDEIEQYFIEQERILRPHERKAYIYVIFDLQKHFTQLIAKSMPQGLDEAEVERHFIEEICRIDADEGFWAGLPRSDRLHDYLIRYVIMFFDSEYPRPSFLRDYIREFMDRRRDFTPPPPRSRVSVDEAGEVFEVAAEKLKVMSRREITRIYRQRAQSLHPDKGGDPAVFIRLTEAYHSLIRKTR